MAVKIESGLILLTYKGKVLLMLKNKPALLSHLWRFIAVDKEDGKTFEELLSSRVNREMSVRISSIEFISKIRYDGTTKYFYHARLTDKDVNTIERAEGQDINFYSTNELDSLPVTASTKLFIIKHRDLIRDISAHVTYSG